MLLRRLKSNKAINTFLIPVAALAFWAKNLWHPFIYDYSVCENSNVLYSPIAKLIGEEPLIHALASLVLLIVLAFLMQLINVSYSFIRIRSKLPGILFVFIVAGFVGMQTLHPIYFGAIFVLFAIYRLFSIFEKSKPYAAVFDVGFLLGIGSMFCLNLVTLFPAFLISIGILSRETRWREFVIILLGFLLPFVFAISYAFLSDNLLEILDNLTQSLLHPINHFKGNLALQVYLVILLLYTFWGSIDILKQYDKKKISSRKYFTAFFWIFVFSIIGFVFIPSTSQEILIITAIPITFLIGNLFVFMKRRFWGEFLFSLLLILVILIQFSEQIFNGQ